MMRRINESVINGIREKDEKSFSKLYNAYFTYLCSYAASFIFDPYKAEEIVNDVFVNIWKNSDSLLFPVHSYLLKSTQNGCLNHIRSLKSQDSFLDRYKNELLNYQEENCLYDSDPSEILEFKELEKRIKREVNSLPQRCRLVFEMYAYQGKSTKEIARELNISIDTVRVQVKKALDKLKKQLGPIAIFFLLINYLS